MHINIMHKIIFVQNLQFHGALAGTLFSYFLVEVGCELSSQEMPIYRAPFDECFQSKHLAMIWAGKSPCAGRKEREP
jgi:hypothetical protein